MPLPAASVLGIPTRVGPFARTRLFSWAGKMRMGAELFVPRRDDEGDESIGAFMTRRFGREATTYLAEPLLAGIHAGDVDRLSVQALFPRFVEAEREHGSLLRAFRLRRPAASADGAFHSLPGGLSEMIRALVTAIGQSRVRTGVGVAAVEGGGPFHVRTTDGEIIDARTVILATPAYVTSALTADRDAMLTRLCGEIPYASAATIALAFNRDAIAHPLNGSGFVVPRVERTGLLAASWLSSKWPHRAPEGRVLLRTFVGGARDPAGARALRPRTGRAVARGVEAAPRRSRASRCSRACTAGCAPTRSTKSVTSRGWRRSTKRSQQHPGLFITGSGFRGVGIPDCIADARKTAVAVREWLTSLKYGNGKLKSAI